MLISTLHRRNAHWSARDVRSALASLIVAVSCGGGGDSACIPIPGCLPTVAVSLSVTSAATHAPLNGVTVQVNGAEAPPCSGTCGIAGGAGKYVIAVSAPGFQSTERTVTVTEGTPRVVDVTGPGGYEGKSCGCSTVNQAKLDVVLVPIS